MFNNPYPYGQPPQVYPTNQQFTRQPAPQMQVVKVNGWNGANAFPMGPNSSALLLDESGAMVWLATTDGAGYKTVSPYDISPHKEELKSDLSGIESRLSRLEEIVNGYSANSSTAQRSADTAPAADSVAEQSGSD